MALWQLIIDYKNDKLDTLIQDYANYDALFKQTIVVEQAHGQSQEGIANGINTSGCLRLQHSLGESLISVGEISVRPKQ